MSNYIPHKERKQVFHKAPEASKGDFYRRSRNAHKRHLDYSKVDWAALAEEVEGQPYGNKRPIYLKWALRLRCSFATLYRGLNKYKNGEL